MSSDHCLCSVCEAQTKATLVLYFMAYYELMHHNVSFDWLSELQCVCVL